MIRKLFATLLLACLIFSLWCAGILVFTTSGLRLEFALLGRFIPGTLFIQKIQGSLFGGFQLTQVRYDNQEWAIHAKLESVTLVWRKEPVLSGIWQLELSDLSRFSETVHGKAMGNGKISGTLLNPVLSGLVTSAGIDIAGQPIGNPTATLAFSLQQNLHLKGNLHLVANLETLPPLVSEWVREPAGRLNLDFALKGFITNPGLTGKAHLAEGSLLIPITGMRPDHIELDATLSDDWHVNFAGNFMAGSGSGKVDGNIQPDGTITLALKGANLLAANLAHWHVVASPALNLQVTSTHLQMSGRLLIPEALITTSKVSGTVTLPDDVMFATSASANASQLPYLTALQLEIQLGDHIHIATQNLTADLTGQLHITQLPGGPMTGMGELQIPQGNNTFQAYGQTLGIRTGRLIYTGGLLVNPGLSITAVKTLKTFSLSENSSSFTTANTALQPVYAGSQTITVGAHIAGSLDEPTLNLFSDPAMNQADILSYLIFGYPRSHISGQQTGMLLTALSALTPDSLSSKTSFTHRLQKKLGISELNLESTQFYNPATSRTVSTTALVIGKQLAPKLSLHYSIGLFYPVSILNLRYKINKNWVLQTENSTMDNGADLLFGIERD